MAAGLLGVFAAGKMDAKSSFESGAFLIEMVLGIGGMACVVVGVLLFLAALFVAL